MNFPFFDLFLFFGCLHSDCFSPDSAFLRQLLFFFSANNAGDFSILVEVCQFLQQYMHGQGMFFIGSLKASYDCFMLKLIYSVSYNGLMMQQVIL